MVGSFGLGIVGIRPEFVMFSTLDRVVFFW